MAIRQFVKFVVGEQDFGVDINLVREISKIQEMLKVPNTPPYIEGLMNLRGHVLTIFNLRKRLGMPDQAFDENSKIIIVWHNDLQIGFTVDMVSEIMKVEDSDVENTPPSITGIDKRFLSGVIKSGDKMILTLDLTKVLSSDEEKELKTFIKKAKTKS
ncbi:MAG: chemotaxis protein CheW [Clostridiaceae bacterium]|jgi:purine-binding chemotaxis protein CheW|nr:chemotaxis protein CheW [Clostridiaceae bacterium]